MQEISIIVILTLFELHNRMPLIGSYLLPSSAPLVLKNYFLLKKKVYSKVNLLQILLRRDLTRHATYADLFTLNEEKLAKEV